MAITGKEILLIIINIIFPPLAVFMMTGCGADLCINILLTILGYIPGHIHGFWIMYKKHKAEKLYGVGGYAYQGNGRFVPATQPAMVAPAGYGTM